MMRQASDPRSAAITLALVLITSIIALSLTVTFSNPEDRLYYSEGAAMLTASVALAASLVVVFRQKLDGLHGRTYAAVAIGLTLWIIAEIIWDYYEFVLGIESPFPSIADAFWLAGYAPFAYHLFRTYKFFGKAINRYVMVIAASGSAVFLSQIIMLVFATMESYELSDIVSFSVAIAYPILDAMLLVPAVTILAFMRKGELTSIPWILLSSAMVLYAVGDSGFAYDELVNLTEEIWVWNLLYYAGDLCIAAALFWHNKFFILDDKRKEEKART